MTTKINLESAYLLHSINYRETSLIAHIFTKQHGIINTLARSARGPRSRFKGSLISFAPLLISATGRTDLLQLTAVEVNGAAIFLEGDSLFSAMYLNELIFKLLHRYDPYPNLFLLYEQTLLQLQSRIIEQQVVLRQFEKMLLAELGYGLNLSQLSNGEPVNPNEFYYYQLEEGLALCTRNINDPYAFKGSHLLAIQENNYNDMPTLKTARTFMRIVIGALLNGLPVKSRELFAASKLLASDN